MGYLEEVKLEEGLGLDLAALFPLQTIPGLEYSYIKGANGPIELSSPSAFDAEPINQNREGFDALAGQMPLFRKKMVLSEKEKYMLDLYIKSGNEAALKSLLAKIYNDQKALVEGALMTMEFLRARALFDGKINMVSKGGAVVVDYKVPATNKIVLTGNKTWSTATADIIGDIVKWMDQVEEATGVRPDTILLNRRTAKLFAKNDAIRDLAAAANYGPGAVGKLALPEAAYSSVLAEVTGLSSIKVYNKKVKLDGSTLDLVEDNKLALFKSGALGDMLVGNSPAELAAGRAGKAGADISVTGDGIAINVLSNDRAPYTTETEAEFIGLPSLPVADQIIQATVA